MRTTSLDQTPRALLGFALVLLAVFLTGIRPSAASADPPGSSRVSHVAARTATKVPHPRSAPSKSRDADKDRLTDWTEVVRTGTNPRLADTDKDGLTDGTEVKNTLTNPRKADSDGDGFSDAVEVLARTDPRNPSSHPAASQPTPPAPSAAPPADTTPPNTSIASGPANPTASTTASFSFASSESGSRFECKLDGAAFSTCASPMSYSGLSVSSHTFSVRAKDGAGNVDASPATRTWTIQADTTPPNTSIASGPTNPTASTTASFSFASSESGSRFECKLDGAAFSTCASPKSYSGLSEEDHTISVRAKDGAGNVDATPATRTWTVEGSTPPADTTPPNTSIASGPANPTASTTASFSFASSESGSSFECKLDGAGFSSCSSSKSYSGLSVGSHTVSVRAKDGAGNVDATPATRTWTIHAGTPPPEPSGPTFYIRDGGTSSSCSDWANACDALPSTLKRGATYYIAGGTYNGRTFDTAASGTSPIAIYGATAAKHGTGTGWSSAYSVKASEGGSQAVWTSGLVFNTSYWIFDGAAGPTWSKATAEYGFKINPTAYAVRVYNTSSPISDVTVSHIAATAPAGDIEKFFLSTDNSTKSVNDVTLSNALLNGWSNAVWATSAGLQMNNWLIENNVILNGFSSAANHGEDINNNYGHLDNLTVRYNIFEGRKGSTGCIVVLNGPAGPYYIYGNVFRNMEGGDGIITGVHYKLTGAIYNNTFDHVDNGYGNGAWIGHDVGATVSNNIIHNGVAAIGANFTGTRDYNAYFNTTSTPSEAHGYTSSANPFVANASGNFKLTPSAAAVLPAGSTLPAPYGQDVEGVSRGSGGKWDRGALETP